MQTALLVQDEKTVVLACKRARKSFFNLDQKFILQTRWLSHPDRNKIHSIVERKSPELALQDTGAE